MAKTRSFSPGKGEQNLGITTALPAMPGSKRTMYNVETEIQGCPFYGHVCRQAYQSTNFYPTKNLTHAATLR